MLCVVYHDFNKTAADRWMYTFNLATKQRSSGPWPFQLLTVGQEWQASGTAARGARDSSHTTICGGTTRHVDWLPRNLCPPGMALLQGAYLWDRHPLVAAANIGSGDTYLVLQAARQLIEGEDLLNQLVVQGKPAPPAACKAAGTACTCAGRAFCLHRGAVHACGASQRMVYATTALRDALTAVFDALPATEAAFSTKDLFPLHAQLKSLSSASTGG